MTETEALYYALSQSYGVALTCQDREVTRQKLYVARQKAKDPALDELSIKFYAQGNEIWIVQKAQLTAETAAPARQLPLLEIGDL